MAYKDSQRKVRNYYRNKAFKSVDRASSKRNSNAYYKPPKIKGYKSKVTYSLDKNGILRQHTTYSPISRRNSVSSVGIFKGVLFFLLIVVFFGMLDENSMMSNITFAGFLNILSNAPVVKTDWIKDVSVSIFSLGQFDNIPEFFKNLLYGVISTFAMPIRVVLYVGTGLVQTLIYLYYFLYMFFGF